MFAAKHKFLYLFAAVAVIVGGWFTLDNFSSYLNLKKVEAASAQNGEDGQAGGCYLPGFSRDGQSWSGKTGGLASGNNGGVGGKGAPAGCGNLGGRGGAGGRGADVSSGERAGFGGNGGQGGTACTGPGANNGDCVGTEPGGDGGRGGDGGNYTYNGNVLSGGIKSGYGGVGGASGGGGARGGDGGNGGDATINGDLIITSGDYKGFCYGLAAVGDLSTCSGYGGNGGDLSLANPGNGGNGGNILITGQFKATGSAGGSYGVIKSGYGGKGANGGKGGNTHLLNINVDNQNNSTYVDFGESIVFGGYGGAGITENGGDAGDVIIESNVYARTTTDKIITLRDPVFNTGGGGSGKLKGGNGGRIYIKGDYIDAGSAVANNREYTLFTGTGGTGNSNSYPAGDGGCFGIEGLFSDSSSGGDTYAGYGNNNTGGGPGGKGGDAVVGSCTSCSRIHAGVGGAGTPPGANGKLKSEGGSCQLDTNTVPTVVLTATPSTSADICPVFTNLAWTDAHLNSGDGYNVYRCDGASCDPTEIVALVDYNQLTYVDNDPALVKGNTYKYRVEVLKGGVLSNWKSNIAQVIPQCTVNQPPVADARISKDNLTWSNSITVTQGVPTPVYLAAAGPGWTSSDPNGWTGPGGVSSSGRCEWNADLDQLTIPPNSWADKISGPQDQIKTAPLPSASSCNISLGTLTFWDAPGLITYQVLKIWDNLGLDSAIDFVQVDVVANAKPVIGGALEENVDAGQTVVLDNYIITDADNDGPYTVSWAACDGGTLNDYNVLNPIYTAPSPGVDTDYHCPLKAKDAPGFESDPAIFTIHVKKAILVDKGNMKVKRVGQTDTVYTAPIGSDVRIKTPSQTMTSNPADFTNIEAKDYQVSVKEVSGKSIEAWTCTYVSTECFVSTLSPSTPVTSCNGGWCDYPTNITVEKDKWTKVIFKYFDARESGTREQ